MKKLNQLLLMTFFIASTAFATDKGAAGSTDMPIDLEADEATYDQEAGLAVYTGNVKVKQGASTIWADKLTIVLKDNAAERIEATGNPVKFHYAGDEQPIEGQGKEALYELTTKTVTLTGNAIVKQGTDTVKGDRLSYNLDKEIIQGKRVKMTFKPK